MSQNFKTLECRKNGTKPEIMSRFRISKQKIISTSLTAQKVLVNLIENPTRILIILGKNKVFIRITNLFYPQQQCCLTIHISQIKK